MTKPSRPLVAALGAVTLSGVLWAAPNVWVLTSLLVYSILTVPGFRDDYLKIVHKNRAGIASREKILWQSLAAFAAMATLTLHPVSAGPIPELAGSMRDGVSVRKLRLSEPTPSSST